MKKILLYIMIVGLVFSSCELDDEDFGPRIPNFNENIGAITLINVNPDANFFNALNPLEDEKVEFELDVDGFGVTEISSVDVEVTYTAVGRLPNPDPDGDPLDQVFDPVLVESVTTFPATITINATDLAGLLGVTVDSFRVGDNFRALFPINTADGKRLKVAVNSDLCQQPAQPSFGGCNVDWGVTCPVSDDFAVGTYQMEYVNGPAGIFSDREVVLTVAGPTSRSMPVTYFGFDLSLTINLVCGEVTVPEQGAGVGCTNGIIWGQGSPPDGFSTSFDLQNDSEFTISLTDDVTGDCDATDNSLILKLTKL